MDDLQNRDQPRPSAILRMVGIVVIVTVIALLITASRLNPDSSGIGTHHQLGLPPCSFRVIWGIRCPSCGMTTSWAHLTNGQLLSAAKVSLSGTLLAFYSLYSLIPAWGLIRNGRIPSDKVLRLATITLGAIASVALAEWGIRLLLP